LKSHSKNRQISFLQKKDYFGFLKIIIKMKKILYCFVWLVTHTALAQKGVIGEKAMVVSAHPDATRIGLEILRKGGNAFDAAVAVNFALAVSFPVAGNIGGGGLLVYRQADGTIGALDYREKAPAKAHRDMYLDNTGKVTEKLSEDGHLASGVPGNVAGMWALHQKFGKLPWQEVVQPAVDLAQNGVTLTEKEANGLNRYREAFVKLNTFKPHLVKEGIWNIGEIIKHTDLAATLARIRDYGRDGFYAGHTAFLIVKEMQKKGGLISYEDLQNYQAVWRRPLVGKYKNHRIISMPPVSSGGVLLLQMLSMIESYDLKKLGWHSTACIQLLTEVERRVFADRAEYLGDSDFFPVPIDNLLSKKYLQKRMANFSWAKATPSSEISAGKFAPAESDQTTHYSIVDETGASISVTTTLNGGYGSKVVVEGGGFLLNNEMDDFSIKPGYPNMFGVIGGAANAVEAGKRMLSSMTPTIVEEKGKLKMLVGTPGGSTIPTSVFQTILNVLEFNMTMQEAVNARRVHHQWLPDVILQEDDNLLPEKTRQELQNKGYKLTSREPIGRVDAILVLPDGKLEGGADRRGDDKAGGY
jgi:gamma-glutamyltranspeptidase/glutathione hydrolase